MFSWISDHIQKFANPYDDPESKPCGNRFMLITLGNKETFTLDIVFEQHLARTKIPLA